MTKNRLMAEGIERGNIKLREREKREVEIIKEYLKANPRKTASEIRRDASSHDSVLLPWMVQMGIIEYTKFGHTRYYELKKEEKE